MIAPITTRSYDNARSGATVNESILTAGAVGTRGIRKLYSLDVPGDACGVEAQPLVVPGVVLADGTTHDVVFLADMANQAWAFDAQDGAQLWKVTVGTPIKGSRPIDSYLINDHWGILSTPVIDAGAGIMYLVAWSSPDGSVAQAQFYCHALSLKDGTPTSPAINLEGASFNAGHGTQAKQFRSAARKQRAALLLTDIQGVKTVFIGFGSISESSAKACGWIIACSTEPLALSTAWASTAKGQGGGIWHGAGGLASDAQGHIYALTGNGDFDGITDFGESVVKLRYRPPTATTPAALNIIDWWTPFTDKLRTSTTKPPPVFATGVTLTTANVEPPTPPASAPTNYLHHKELLALGMDGGWDDQDLASGGPVLLEGINAVLACGKDGVAYVVDAANMGKTTLDDIDAAKNYAQLKAAPLFFTYYWPGKNPAPPDIRSLNGDYGQVTHHLHGNAVVFESPDLGPVVYCWGENGNLRAWSLSNKGVLTYLACSAEMASPNSPVPPGGMPGGMICVSAEGGSPRTGIVWALVPYEDANKSRVAGRLLAYDATNFSTFADGSKQLRVLWDSQTWNLPFTFNKFNRPVVWDGKLYVPTFDARVDVYGLA